MTWHVLGTVEEEKHLSSDLSSHPSGDFVMMDAQTDSLMSRVRGGILNMGGGGLRFTSSAWEKKCWYSIMAVVVTQMWGQRE